MVPYLEKEKQLVLRAQEGCFDSFTYLVEAYEEQVYSLGYLLTEDPRKAEEVLQKVFLRAFADLRHFRGESRFYAWLARFAVNEALSRLNLRHDYFSRSLEDSRPCEDPSAMPSEVRNWQDGLWGVLTTIEGRFILVEALLHLDFGMRLVFVLRDMDKLSTEDTARVLDCPVRLIKNCLSRARLKVRNWLSDYLEVHSDLVARTGTRDASNLSGHL